jgi:hypothetical protein
MKQNIKNPLATGQVATVQPGRADSDFDAANAAAQQQFLAGMAAAQETMNNANNNQATSNW